MYRPFRLFPLIILLVVFTGCTIEKRLYTKGWSVSSNRGWKQKGSIGQQQEHSEEDVAFVVPVIKPSQDIVVSVAESIPIAPVVTDSSAKEADLSVIAAVAESEDVTDTLSASEKKPEKKKTWTKERKKHAVITVSVLMLFTAIGIVAAMLTINAPATGLVATFGLIGLTLVLGMLFFILLVLLLVFLTRRPVDKPRKTREEMTPDELRKDDVRNGVLAGIVIAAAVLVLFKLFDQ
jgi:hypothetical protein